MAAAKLTAAKTSRVTRSVANAVANGGFVETDATEGNSFVNEGRQVLLLTTDGSEREVSFLDRNGVVVRKVKLAKEKLFAFGPFDRYNYGDPLVFKTTNKAVKAAVVTLDELQSAQSRT